MSEFKIFKVVGSLPEPLLPSAVYLVRVGQGFDLYVTNETGEINLYQQNRLRPYAVTIGDGTSTEFDVTHNLNSLDVRVEIYDQNDQGKTILADVHRLDQNTLRIKFATDKVPAIAQYRVLVS